MTRRFWKLGAVVCVLVGGVAPSWTVAGDAAAKRMVHLDVQVWRLPAELTEEEIRKTPFSLNVQKTVPLVESMRLASRMHEPGITVLAKPVLRTVSGRPAVFRSGGEVAVAASVLQSQVEWLPFGTTLEVLPTIESNGKLRIRFKLEQTTHHGETTKPAASSGSNALVTQAVVSGVTSQGVVTLAQDESVLVMIPDLLGNSETVKTRLLAIALTPQIVDEMVPVEKPAEAAKDSGPQIDIDSTKTIRINPEDDGNPWKMHLRQSEAAVVELSGRKIVRVQGFDPDYLTVTADGPNRLRVVAEREGSASLLIEDEADEWYAVELHIGRAIPAKALTESLKKLFPEARVEVIELRESLLLRGTAPSPQQIEQIREVAAQFAPQVVNHLRIGLPERSDDTASDEASVPVQPTDELQQLRQEVRRLNENVKRLQKIVEGTAAVPTNPAPGNPPAYYPSPYALPSPAPQAPPLSNGPLPNYSSSTSVKPVPNETLVPKYAAPPRSEPDNTEPFAPAVPTPPAATNASPTELLPDGTNPEPFVAVKVAPIDYPGNQSTTDEESFGSGVVIQSEPNRAILLTAAHHLHDYQPGKCVLQVYASAEMPSEHVEGKKPIRRSGWYPATVVLRDEVADVAILRAKIPFLIDTVPLATHSLPDERSRVRCVGFERPATQGKLQSLRTVEMLTGTVAAVNRYQGPENFELEGIVPNGFSGAAVLDARGELIGLANAVDLQDHRTLCTPAAEIRKLLAKPKSR